MVPPTPALSSFRDVTLPWNPAGHSPSHQFPSSQGPLPCRVCVCVCVWLEEGCVCVCVCVWLQEGWGGAGLHTFSTCYRLARRQILSVLHPHPLRPLCHFTAHQSQRAFIPNSQHLRWYAGKYLTTTSGDGRTLICNVSQFPWCNYSHRGWFQAINVRLTSLQNS